MLRMYNIYCSTVAKLWAVMQNQRIDSDRESQAVFSFCIALIKLSFAFARLAFPAGHAKRSAVKIYNSWSNYIFGNFVMFYEYINWDDSNIFENTLISIKCE